MIKGLGDLGINLPYSQNQKPEMESNFDLLNLFREENKTNLSLDKWSVPVARARVCSNCAK